MAGFPALTPQQQQAFQQAVTGSIAQMGSGGSQTTYGNDIEAALASSGAFTPEELQALDATNWLTSLQAGGDYQNKNGGNTNAFTSDDVSALDQSWQQAAQNGTSAAATNSASPTNNANPAAAAANPTQTITPATIQGQFPNGIPTQTASGIGSIPAINATSVIAGMGGAGAYSANNAIQATENYELPQFQQQDAALQAALANAGIVGGTTGQGINQLGSQQQTQLNAQVQPLIQSEQQLEQQGLTTDANNNQAAQTANQGATIAGSEFNATTNNQAQQFNIQNLLQTGQIDAATANAMSTYLMGLQNSDWQAQLGAQTTTANNGAGITSGAFQPVYQQPSGTNLSGVGSAFGSSFNPTPAASAGGAGSSSNGIYTPSGGAFGSTYEGFTGDQIAATSGGG